MPTKTSLLARPPSYFFLCVILSQDLLFSIFVTIQHRLGVLRSGYSTQRFKLEFFYLTSGG